MADQIDINLGGLKLITCDRSFTRDVAQLIQTFENSNFVVELTVFIMVATLVKSTPVLSFL